MVRTAIRRGQRAGADNRHSFPPLGWNARNGVSSLRCIVAILRVRNRENVNVKSFALYVFYFHERHAEEMQASMFVFSACFSTIT